jgi:ribosome-binding ATPase YchF (GTP1/OBG family)
MKAGIVGLPNVGNQHYLIVCQCKAQSANFPFV